MDEVYDLFRTDFGRRMEALVTEFNYGLPILIAEHDPRSVKPSYEFLSDASMPRKEKLKLLKAAADAVSATPHELFRYVIDFRQVVQPEGPVSEYIGLMRKLLGK